MELASVKQLCKNIWNLLFYYAGAVVLYDNFVLELGHFNDFYAYLGKHPCLFACVKRVVYSFLHSHQQCFPLVVKPKQMPVFCEKFSYRDFLLPFSKLICNWRFFCFEFLFCHTTSPLSPFFSAPFFFFQATCRHLHALSPLTMTRLRAARLQTSPASLLCLLSFQRLKYCIQSAPLSVFLTYLPCRLPCLLSGALPLWT